MRWLLIPKQFLRVFDKTYQHYDRGTHQADEEHNLEEPHAKDCDLHALDCSVFCCVSHQQNGDSQRDSLRLSGIRAQLTLSDTACVDPMQ